MKKLFLATTAMALLIPSSAQAAKFSGVFLGLNVGYSTGDAEVSYEDGNTGNGDFSIEDEFDGFEGGAFAGFRHQFLSGFNLGLEGGYLISGADGSTSLNVAGNTFTMPYEKSNEWYLSIKPGFAFAENTIGYGILGYQQADFKGEILFNGVSLGSADDDFDGYHIGLGIEHALDHGFSLRGEFRYNDYDDVKVSDATTGEQDTYEIDESVFRVGVAYNFNTVGKE